MALLLIIPFWILVLSLVLAVCVAARRGDQQEERRVRAAATAELPSRHRLAIGGQSSEQEEEHELLGASRSAA